MNYYTEHLKNIELEHQYYCKQKDINNNMLYIISQIQFNKTILCSKYFNPSQSDIKKHQERFDRLLEEVNNYDKELKKINYNYSPKRMKTIKQSIIKIRNYENKRIS